MPVCTDLLIKYLDQEINRDVTMSVQCSSVTNMTGDALRVQNPRPITRSSGNQNTHLRTKTLTVTNDMNRNQEVGFLNDFYTNHHHNNHGTDEPLLDINVRNLENLSLMDNFNAVSSTLTALENNENLSYFTDNFDSSSACGAPPSFLDDPKEGNISRTVRVPSSEHVAEIVGRQGCKIKDLRARTNTYIKTPMRTQSPVFVVTGKEEAVLHVMDEINNAAEHFTHIRASRNHHKAGGGGGLDAAKPMSREGDIVMYVTVPYRVVGLVVGLKGQTIKAIQQDTDTFIVTPNRDKEPTFEIRGQPDNVKRAEMMIQRHIETRTRHCRLQDTTNLPTNWSDEQRYSGNDYPYYHSDLTASDNSHSSGSVSSVSSQFNGNSSSMINGQSQQQLGSGGFPSAPIQGNYRTWRGYNSLMEQHPQQQSNPLTTWSNGGSDFMGGLAGDSMMSNGASPPRTQGHSSSIHYTMSSPSNSSTSVSPPNDILNEASPLNNQFPSPFSGQSLNGPFMQQRISESSSTESNPFSSFSFFSSAPATTPKNSLVLGNLFQQSNNNNNNTNTSSLSISGLMSNGGNSILNGTLDFTSLSCDNNPIISATTGNLHQLQMNTMKRALPGEMNLFTNQNGDMFPKFPSGESSPTSKSCSLSETSGGSQGSPTPKLCKVCEEAEVVAALVPCGHNLFCMECAQGIINKPAQEDRVCPVCKDTATDALHIRA